MSFKIFFEKINGCGSQSNKLIVMSLSNKEIVCLDGIENYPNLEEVIVIFKNKFENIKTLDLFGIDKCINLEKFTIPDSYEFINTNKLKNLKSLKRLTLNDSDINESTLETLVNLEWLSINRHKIKSFKFLKKLKKLKTISISNLDYNELSETSIENIYPNEVINDYRYVENMDNLLCVTLLKTCKSNFDYNSPTFQYRRFGRKIVFHWKKTGKLLNLEPNNKSDFKSIDDLSEFDNYKEEIYNYIHLSYEESTSIEIENIKQKIKSVTKLVNIDFNFDEKNSNIIYWYNIRDEFKDKILRTVEEINSFF